MSGVELLPLIDEDVAVALVDPRTLVRARSYVGAVTQLHWNSEAQTLSARVLGNSAAPYRCRVDLREGPSGFTPTFTACSCPVQVRCKHVAAVLLACAQRAQREDERAVQELPAWKSAVESMVSTDAARETTPLALGFELRLKGARRTSTTASSLSAATSKGVRLGIRPLMPGKRGWIKGTLTWRTLAHQINRLRLDPDQLMWFTQMLGLFDATREKWLLNESDTLSLDDFRSPLLWRLLADAESTGVRLVGINRNTTVELAESARISLDVRAQGRGLQLAPLVVIDGMPYDARRVAPVAEHGVYAYAVSGSDIHVLLAPTMEPLTGERRALLARPDTVDVPPDDVPEFLGDYYPRVTAGIEVTSSDRSVDLPEVSPPELVLAAEFGAKDALSLTWRWRYHAPERDLPFDARPGERRDADRERETRGRVERAWPGGTEHASRKLHDVDTAEFTEHVLPTLERLEGVRVEVSGKRPVYRELTASPHVTVSTVESEKNDWFDLGIIVTIEGRPIPFIDLFEALARGRKKLKLVDGTYFSLGHPAFERLRELLAESDALDEWEPGAPIISRYQVGLWADFEDLADETVEAVTWRETVAGLSGSQEVVRPEPPVRATLRPYQREGFQWLAFLWEHRLGGILADDMGLGKTLQTLALIAHAREQGEGDAEEPPFLVVAPTSVVSTWRSEAQRFTPHLDVRVVDATRGRRHVPLEEEIAGADVVIMSYAVMRIDAAHVAKLSWAGLVLDEAQFVKNPDSKAHQAAADIDAPFRLAITGTPLENTLLDLWALCSITAPGLFPSRRRFSEEYVRPIEGDVVPERIARLRRRVRPFMMRRTKEAVAADLPPKQEQTVEVELAADHRSLYDTVLQRERKKLLGLIDDLDRNRFIVFRSLTLLRMLALDPALVDDEYAGVTSSKLDALFEQLDDVIAEGHRMLVFSQFTSFLKRVAERLDARGIPYSYLDGSTRRRGEVIEAFRAGDAPVFLISLKAGGFGLTLTEADYVFMLDPWWNPASEAQAIDRTHRIGQTQNVMVYRLVAEGTIEEKVMALQRKKAALFDAVVDEDAAFSSALTADDIRALLTDD
ncbi:SNF2-related protein [Paramicrobacterium sp. CJ85]|uniref:DEAD/DEAH box helicase n=1 Tax=Paramicrobacterium sp. CJ85 TaxID=3445355 RepID=UPI003F5E6D12